MIQAIIKIHFLFTTLITLYFYIHTLIGFSETDRTLQDLNCRRISNAIDQANESKDKQSDMKLRNIIVWFHFTETLLIILHGQFSLSGDILQSWQDCQLLPLPLQDLDTNSAEVFPLSPFIGRETLTEASSIATF